MLTISTSLAYRYAEPTDILLQIEAAMIPEQTVYEGLLTTSPVEYFARVAGHDEIGERIWIRVNGLFEVNYSARVAVDRVLPDLATLPPTQPHLLPGETVDYLIPSRFCPSDRFAPLADDEFNGLEGGARIAAMRDWVNARVAYEPGASDALTTASETLLDRRGVCRDFAHLMIALARASAIPARYACVYAPDVEPPDFHAVAEVFLAGAWHLVDATGMAQAGEMAKVGVGRDAADLPFLSSFGTAEFVAQSVAVARA